MPSRQPPEDTSPVYSPAAIHAHPLHTHHDRPHHLILLVASSAAAALAVCLSVALVVLLYRRIARGRAAPTAPSPPPPPPLRRFSYAQLRRATASFFPSLKLGQGGFGPVFRGALPSSGEEVAVKLMDSGSLQGEQEFQNELVLASKILPMPPSADRASVVTPIGYCCDYRHLRRGRRWWRWWMLWWRKSSTDESPELLDACATAEAAKASGRRLLLVYELMHNGSLQDALLDRRSPELMNWGRRFAVALDVARALQFLHCVCDPPVIHGDIKPSNILLDAGFSAKIGDFGLARIKSAVAEDEHATKEVAAAATELDKGFVAFGSGEGEGRGGGGGGEDDASLMAESTTTTVLEDQNFAGCEHSIVTTLDRSQEDEEEEGLTVASPVVVHSEPSPSEAGGGFDKASLDSTMETTLFSSHKCGRKKSGATSRKDWWWRQDGSEGGANLEGGGSVKDYVMEWIRSEIKKERPRGDQADAPASAEDCPPKACNGRGAEQKKSNRKIFWWPSSDEERLKKKEKSRPAREWWREEFCEELTNKHKKRAIAAKLKGSIEGGSEKQWWEKDEDSASPSQNKRKKKSFKCSDRSSRDWWMDGMSGDLRTTGRRSSLDWPSCDIPKSGTVSSTPSMRGTVCYVAPEYGGGGPLSEKCDIYSFGVLLLVIISGRRPLQVTASPISEFEKANLISFARKLARSERLFELVDPSLRDVDKGQAILCITVGLLCLQRSPARRPSIKEIFSMLTGQTEPPNLPHEFSPSPPGLLSFKSRKKAQ